MVHTKNIKRFAVNISILLFSLCFFIFVSEVILRIFSHTSLIRVDHHKLFCEYDSLLGWKKSSNTKGEHKTSEYFVIETTNSKGIRGPEYSYDKGENEYRIVILGDSFAEGYSVEFNNLFSEILKTKLNAEGNGCYEVINAGTGGYSTDQELLFFQTEGQKYNPDVTILMFYDNDVWYNNQPKYWRGHKPLFKLNDKGNLELTNIPVPRIGKKINEAKGLLERIKCWVKEKSYLYNFIADKVKNNPYLYALAINIGLAREENVLTRYSRKVDTPTIAVPSEFGVYSKRYGMKVSHAWKITEAILSNFKKETLSIGSKLLVFYIPSRAAIYIEEWNAMRRKYGFSDVSWKIDQVGIELRNICKRNDIDFIDPTELFKARASELKKNKKRLYFFRDGHWNNYGHKLTGKILAEYISLENKAVAE